MLDITFLSAAVIFFMRLPSPCFHSLPPSPFCCFQLPCLSFCCRPVPTLVPLITTEVAHAPAVSLRCLATWQNSFSVVLKLHRNRMHNEKIRTLHKAWERDKCWFHKKDRAKSQSKSPQTRHRITQLSERCDQRKMTVGLKRLKKKEQRRNVSPLLADER